MDLLCERCNRTFPSRLWFNDEGRDGRWICVECAKPDGTNELQDTSVQTRPAVASQDATHIETLSQIVRRVRTGRVRPLFFLGVLLLLLGTAVQGLFAGMGLEALLLKNGPPQIVTDSSGRLEENPGWEDYRESILPLFVVLSVLLAIAGAVLGFFASKNRTPQIWYFIITGVIPGVLLFCAWKALRAGLRT